MNSAIDITSEQRKTLVDLLRQYIPGVAVWTYGSRVKWTARPNSDLDLVVFIAASQKRRVEELKSALAESDLPFLVDLHIWDEIPEKFHEIIQKEYVVIQEKRVDSNNFRVISESFLEHPADWPVKRLKEITLKIGSGATPRGGAENYLSQRTGFALIRSQNVFDRYFDPSGLAFISDAQASELQNVIVKPGDLLLNITGDGVTFSRCCAAPDDVLPACVNQHVSIIRVDPNLADPGYVLAFLTHPIIKTYIESFNTGGSRRAITKGHIESFELPLPPISVQHAIAQTLGALDNKIELNRKLNETLEATARANFKSWFVDFDPVRAKAEGREPEGMDADTAAVFPSEFEDSALGPIPQGWTTGPITNVLSLNSARSLKKKVNATYLDMASVPTSGHRANSRIKRDFVSGSKFVNGDTLLARITPCLENGKTAYVDFLEQDEVGWGSTEFIVMATKPNVPSQFAYLLARDPEFRQYAIQSMSGTSGRQRVQVDQLAKFKIAIANDSIYRAFGTLVEPLFQRIKYSSEEQKTLTDLRDTLLPRLISGKLRVPEAEAMLTRV
jgi:type I restriction enzyme S subunit